MFLYIRNLVVLKRKKKKEQLSIPDGCSWFVLLIKNNLWKNSKGEIESPHIHKDIRCSWENKKEQLPITGGLLLIHFQLIKKFMETCQGDWVLPCIHKEVKCPGVGQEKQNPSSGGWGWRGEKYFMKHKNKTCSDNYLSQTVVRDNHVSVIIFIYKELGR